MNDQRLKRLSDSLMKRDGNQKVTVSTLITEQVLRKIKMQKFGKAVIPAAGLGHHVFTCYKSDWQRDCCIVDKPTHSVYRKEEAINSGIEDI